MKTVSERFLGGEEGDYVFKEVDRVMLHDGNAPLLFDDMEGEDIWDPEKVTSVIDHFCPPSTVERANFVERLREFVEEKGIKDHVESGGICHQVMCEGRVLPGELVAGIDSHSTTYGALGAFGVGFGSSDTVEILKEGKTWFRVPETIRVEISEGEDGNDIALSMLEKIRYEANYKTIEFVDKVGLNMDDRLTIANMAAETGAKAAFFPPDEITRRYLQKFDIESDVEISLSEKERCVKEVNISVEEPLVAAPSKPYNVKTLSKVSGKSIDQVFIGSCASGRMSDLRDAAEVLESGKVHPDVRLLVTPASKRVQEKALKEGVIEKLVKAGAVMLNPSCGPCSGIDKGVLAEGETCISTQNRNYPGRMGKGEVYLANAEVCALSAVEGVIPEEVGR
ncbi:MAG: 3-isopropylmalate dehydratase/homoaconitate hydratase family large subunit [Candidatus Thermoplasmatota archaeon]|nr:3-isopropylmalate dehydratase/homoaconitate hydratase family large subunit [Candidatus Thermoplasmatota archaeon]